MDKSQDGKDRGLNWRRPLVYHPREKIREKPVGQRFLFLMRDMTDKNECVKRDKCELMWVQSQKEMGSPVTRRAGFTRWVMGKKKENEVRTKKERKE